MQQLDKSFSLSTAEELETLQKMLTWSSSKGGGAEIAETNPLYLTLADGRRQIVYTSADGSDSVCLFGDSRSYGLGMSIFELFGVPLEAKGYSRSGEIVTTHKDMPEQSSLEWLEYDYTVGGRAIERRIKDFRGVVSARYEYDEAGRLLRETWIDENGEVSNRIENVYAEDGRLLRSTTTNDRFTTEVEYEYDEMGRLSAERHPEAPGGNVYYNYDEDGNCRIVYGFELEQQEAQGKTGTN